MDPPQLRSPIVFLSQWSKAPVNRLSSGEATSTYMGMLEWERSISCMTLRQKGHLRAPRLSLVMWMDVPSLRLSGDRGHSN